MSDTEGPGVRPSANPPPPVLPTPAHSQVVLGTEATVRMSMRPLSQFVAGGDFELWLKRLQKESCIP